MKNNYLKILTLIFALFTLGMQCGDDWEDQFENILDAELQLEVIPSQEKYKINDTISIVAIIEGRSLKEMDSDKTIEVECADIPIRFYVGVRYVNSNLKESDDLFKLIADTINIKNYNIESDGQCSKIELMIPTELHDKGEISLLKIIPNREGIFMMSPTQHSEFIINRADSCDSENPVLDYVNLDYVFDVEDTNKELIDESPLPENVFYRGDPIPSRTDEKRIFWFRITQ